MGQPSGPDGRLVAATAVLAVALWAQGKHFVEPGRRGSGGGPGASGRRGAVGSGGSFWACVRGVSTLASGAALFGGS